MPSFVEELMSNFECCTEERVADLTRDEVVVALGALEDVDEKKLATTKTSAVLRRRIHYLAAYTRLSLRMKELPADPLVNAIYAAIENNLLWSKEKAAMKLLMRTSGELRALELILNTAGPKNVVDLLDV